MSGGATAAPAPWEEAAQQQPMPWDEAKASTSAPAAESQQPSLWERTKAGAAEMFHHPISAGIGILKGTLGAAQGGLPQGDVAPVSPEEMQAHGIESPEVHKWSFPGVDRALSYLTRPQNKAEDAGYVMGADVLPVASSLSQFARGLTPHYSASRSYPVSQSRALAVAPTPMTVPAAESGEALATIPVSEAAPVDPRPANVRGPGEIAPYMPRPRAYFGGLRPEPIPSRPGLMLPGAVEPQAAPVTPKAVSSAVDESLGVEPLKSDVPLRQQVSPKAQPVSQSKAESSVIHSHEYNPEAREMTVTTKSNPKVGYVYGDVDQDQAAIMENATSKGKAWAEFKKGGSPLVAKIVNGERIPVRPVIRPEDMNPEGEARVLRNPAERNGEDLTQQLRDSLRVALNRPQPKSRVVPIK